MTRLALTPLLLSVACTTTPAPKPAAPEPVRLPPTFAVATCVDGTLFPAGAPAPARMGLIQTVLEPTDDRAGLVLQGGCALDASIVACKNQHAAKVDGPKTLILGLDIDEQGEVVDARTQGGRIEDGPFVECVSAALRSTRFPKGAQGKALYRIAFGARVVTMTEVDPWIAGVPVSETRRVLRAAFPRLRECYDRKDAQGLVTFFFTVRSDGTLSEVHLEPGTGMDHPDMLQCMARVVTGLHLPSPPTGQAHVRYAIRFATLEER